MDQPAISYEHILRAIGQGLESLSLEAFDLEVAGDIFSIRGIPTRKESESSPATKLKAFKKAFLDICSSSKAPAQPATPAAKVSASSRLLRLDFTQADIDKLERRGRRFDQIGSAAHCHTACHRSYGRWVGMLTTRRARYIKSRGVVTR
jgi:hypothetical protein